LPAAAAWSVLVLWAMPLLGRLRSSLPELAI
jgi:hypothetical protein